MQLTVKIKLLASAEQEKLIEQTMREYISAVNNIVADMVTFRQMGKLSSRSVGGLLPSALKNQCISDSKSIYTFVYGCGACSGHNQVIFNLFPCRNHEVRTYTPCRCVRRY